MKHCSKCGETKPLEAFSKDGKAKDGLQGACKTCNAAYHAANKERIAERNAKYYAANKERIAPREAAWRAANRERNRPRQQERTRRRRARKKALTTIPFTFEQQAQRLSMWPGGWMCGGPKEHIDHVKPMGKKGPHMLANLRPACAKCNLRKKDKWPFPTGRRVLT